MAISVTSLGSNSTVTGSSGATLALTLGASVAAGSVIVVLVTEGDNKIYGAGCTVTDSSGNTYSAISSRNFAGDASGVGFAQIFYAKNVTALSSGNSITVTKQDNNAALVVEAISATGVDTASPLDTSVTATNDSAGAITASPTVTSGVGSQNGNLVVGAMAWQDTSATTATQPGGSWTGDANTKNASATTRAVGATLAHLVNSGTTAQTYAPTLGASNRWAAFIVGFKVGGVTTPKTVSISSATSVSIGVSRAYLAVVAIASATACSLSRSVSKRIAVPCASAVSVVKAASKKVSVSCSSVAAVVKRSGKVVAISTVTAASVVKTARKVVAVASTTAVEVVKDARKVVAISVSTATAAMRNLAKIVDIGVSVSVSILTALSLRVVIAKIRTFLTSHFAKATLKAGD